MQPRSMARSERVVDFFDESKDEKIDQAKVIEVLKELTDQFLPKLVFFDAKKTLLGYDRSILDKNLSKHISFYQEFGVTMKQTPLQDISSSLYKVS